MNRADTRAESVAADRGLIGLCQIAAYYRLSADATQLHHDLALAGRFAQSADLVRAANRLQLKARILLAPSERRLNSAPLPALVNLAPLGFALLVAPSQEGRLRLIDPVTRFERSLSYAELTAEWSGEIILLTRRAGVGIDPKSFGLTWFLPSLWRYRHPLAHVLLASLFIQIFALVTPLFFQIVVDKVLAHKGASTLLVVTFGMAALGLFNAVMQYLRGYILSHTTNRIDVELGARLFFHLLRLPMLYFETRAVGQIVARMRELEIIRTFLTSQALFSLIDLLFTAIFIAVLFAYSSVLALIVLCSAPVYVVIALLVRPLLREKIRQKFIRNAESQQFLVEAVVGMQTLKAAAIEPIMQASWEEKLAAYVKTAFEATLVSNFAQNATQYVSTATTALIVFFGAQAVIAGKMTVGELIAFNMIANQAVQPILRLSQLFQDFQQVRVSVERIGDILNVPEEPKPLSATPMPAIRGAIQMSGVGFRYRPGSAPALSEVSLSIKPGEVVGVVGPSGIREVDLRQIGPATLPAGTRPGPDRRHRHRPGRSGLAASPDRRGAAGKPAVQPDDPRQYRARRADDVARPRGAHGEIVGRA